MISFFFLVTRVDSQSSFVTNGAADNAHESSVVGARDVDPVSGYESNDICLLLVHYINSSSNALTWSSMYLTSLTSEGLSRVSVEESVADEDDSSGMFEQSYMPDSYDPSDPSESYESITSDSPSLTF